jgi:GNAT superfamily N-acetyltransferase
VLSPLAVKVPTHHYFNSPTSPHAFHPTDLTHTDRLAPTVTLLASVFATDPVITWLLSSLPSAAARQAYLPAYFHALLKAAALNNATFDEIDGWKCVSVLMPPGKRVGNTWTLVPAGMFGVLWKLGWDGCRVSACLASKLLPCSRWLMIIGLSGPEADFGCCGDGLTNCQQRMLLEYEPQTEAMKAKVLRKGEKHYYVFFMGTREDAQGQGLGSELMRHQQDVVRESGLPIWLEATTARSRDLYARLGFEVVDARRFGGWFGGRRRGERGWLDLRCRGGTVDE